VRNLIVFIDYGSQIPIMLGMFGKENVEYLSEFDAKSFDGSHKQIYYHKKLNAEIHFYHHINDFITESDEFFKQFTNYIIVAEQLESRLLEDKIVWLSICIVLHHLVYHNPKLEHIPMLSSLYTHRVLDFLSTSQLFYHIHHP